MMTEDEAFDDESEWSDDSDLESGDEDEDEF
jgi:hypothetical protein